MCLFISMIVPPSALTPAFDAVVTQRRRAFDVIENASLTRQLEPGEKQRLTTVGHCDCGSPLFSRSGKRTEAQLARVVEEKRRKGLGKTKIADWVAATERTTSARSAEARVLDEWADLIDALLELRTTPFLGLRGHFYGGSLDDEVFSLRGRQEHAASALRARPFPALEEDVVHVFRRAT